MPNGESARSESVVESANMITTSTSMPIKKSHEKRTPLGVLFSCERPRKRYVNIGKKRNLMRKSYLNKSQKLNDVFL